MNNNLPDSIPVIAVAPMMDWTDRHCRYFHRLISPHARLYTEMVTTGALIYGERDRFLRFNNAEHPVALQLGGDNPQALADCARMAEDYGYDEVNLNCGCPSDRVQNGNFGACLMAQPERVARCTEAMAGAVNIPVTVKCRIGIDNSEEFLFLNRFITDISNAGCQEFTIHARKAWLQGLSPKENREIPPLKYEVVEEIKVRHPHLSILLNGGIKEIRQIQSGLNVDGYMIGREAYQNPFFLAAIEREIFCSENITSREAVARAMIPYMEDQQGRYGTPLKSMSRHIIGLFKGQAGGRQWRRYLSENSHKKDMTPAYLIEEALATTRQSSEYMAAGC